MPAAKNTTTVKKKTTTKKPDTAPKSKTGKTAVSASKRPGPTQLEPPAWKPIKPKRKTKQPPQKVRKKKSIAEKVAFRKRNQGTFRATFLILVLLWMAYFFTYMVNGYTFSAFVCTCTAGVVGFYAYFPLIFRKFPDFTRKVIRVFTVILCIGLAIFMLTEAVIIHASTGTQDEDFHYLLVLGAKVRPDGPSLSLTNRIDAAYEYLAAHPDTIAVLSGGMGADEPMTEAACMYDQLAARGIDPQRLWMEDQASSTWENVKFTLDLIEEKTGTRPRKLGVISSEYHLFRASLFAREHGVDFAGIPAKTTKPSLKVNYFLREVAGVWHYILLGGRYE